MTEFQSILGMGLGEGFSVHSVGLFISKYVIAFNMKHLHDFLEVPHMNQHCDFIRACCLYRNTSPGFNEDIFVVLIS